MYLPLPQLSSTWVRQAFPPALKNYCHHFSEDAKTGFRGLRGGVRPPNEGAAQPEEPWQGCREAPPPALMELPCSSCNRREQNKPLLACFSHQRFVVTVMHPAYHNSEVIAAPQQIKVWWLSVSTRGLALRRCSFHEQMSSY